jgi:hypothetical protein
MNAQKLFRFAIVLAVTLLGVTACSAPAAQVTPAAQVVAVSSPAPTLVSPTDLPTATTVPPTNTSTATATRLSPTNTPIPPTKTPLPTSTSTLTPTDTPTEPPTPTFTSTLTPTLKPKPTVAATRKPTAKPAAAKSFAVTWNSNVEYNGRTADSFWCQFHNQYQNLTAQEMPFQTFTDDKLGNVILLTFDANKAKGGYQPVIGIANADGTINRWRLGGWYAKAFGWRNGIEQFPPGPLAANAPSDDWTWYSVSQAGEYCKYVYVKWNGQTSAAEFAPDGKLVNPNATLPAGAP